MKQSARRRVRIKICGITNPDDAELAILLGADALGFNTWEGSKRYIDLDTEAEWLEELPPFVTKVALLVNASLSAAESISRKPFIDALQLHGDEDATYCSAVSAMGRPFIKALRVKSVEDFSHLAEFETRHFLMDAHVQGLFGGTGVRVDLDLAAEFRRLHPRLALILAGGLKPENVFDAVTKVRPYAVDVSSGVESEPGRKDPVLLHDFIEAVRAAETE